MKLMAKVLSILGFWCLGTENRLFDIGIGQENRVFLPDKREEQLGIDKRVLTS
jgi:hypothetical protein